MRMTLLCTAVCLTVPSFTVFAQTSDVVVDESVIVSLKYIWMGVCIALVLFMQCGFLLLEGGMVRSKNAVNVILKNFVDIGLGSLGFWMFGFGLMYGVNESGWLGLSHFFPTENSNGFTLTLLYQMMFAATAATIVSGAVAERFSFLPYIICAFFITTLIYPIFGAWAWGGAGDNLGWLAELGFHDAAGATVVHSVGGWCALGALLVIGPRFGRYSRKGAVHDIAGHSLPYVAMGGFILWFGWF
jgi:ammonium transporter, Amt family